MAGKGLDHAGGPVGLVCQITVTIANSARNDQNFILQPQSCSGYTARHICCRRVRFEADHVEKIVDLPFLAVNEIEKHEGRNHDE